MCLARRCRHPTLVPPFNTAIVKGYNALCGAKVKLGRWEEYLAMRRGILALNEKYRDLLSNDLGAVAGALFDIGTGRYPPPPGEAALAEWEADLVHVREEADLALPAQPAHALFLVAPDARERDVRDQLLRPAFSRVADLNVRFIAYSELEAHREAIARFGQGMKAILIRLCFVLDDSLRR